jgi:hypothetical protein
MLLSLHTATPERVSELRTQIGSVPAGSIPPPELRDFPETKALSEKKDIDMSEATKVDMASEVARAE